MQGEQRETTVTTVEWVLPSPANWAELGRVFACVTQAIGGHRGDDAVWMKAWDDELIVYYDKKLEQAKTPGGPKTATDIAAELDIANGLLRDVLAAAPLHGSRICAHCCDDGSDCLGCQIERHLRGTGSPEGTDE